MTAIIVTHFSPFLVNQKCRNKCYLWVHFPALETGGGAKAPSPSPPPPTHVTIRITLPPPLEVRKIMAETTDSWVCDTTNSQNDPSIQIPQRPPITWHAHNYSRSVKYTWELGTEVRGHMVILCHRELAPDHFIQREAGRWSFNYQLSPFPVHDHIIPSPNTLTV